MELVHRGVHNRFVIAMTGVQSIIGAPGGIAAGVGWGVGKRADEQSLTMCATKVVFHKMYVCVGA